MKLMKARYAGTCTSCHGRFPCGADIGFEKSAPKGRKTFHAACVDATQAGTGHVVEFEFNGENGPVFAYQNSNGRCEDAPCCGCCTC